ncbi:PTS sugar transporter subunit IIC [Desulfuromonas sp. CSMB_57]|jgi:PTS system mannose-specific IIC component|uniref:PTS sugar transporter subunit IIC n=1 Tax=Desulfuromonas sp. CSMB_57 TaxID=2807629 RepID=UPI001CD75579|nr:PTS sugar transporter subunit IIC [Desulfuromonas sp. CSMB_57]
MTVAALLWAALTSIFAGLDRTALCQVMLARPIVVAPLLGWLLGMPLVGLQAGALIELLWVGRLPVGAAVPPDDTQLAVASTLLAVTSPLGLLPAGFEAVICVFLVLPFGRAGEAFDRLARRANNRLPQLAGEAIEQEQYARVKWLHLQGMAAFALASLATCIALVTGGWLLLHGLVPHLRTVLAAAGPWLWPVLPVLGSAVVLAGGGVRHAWLWFGGTFLLVYVLRLVF